MGAGGGSTPEVVHPGEAAQAATGSAGAGEMMAVANQPVENYANLATMTQLGPAEQQTQSALQNQAAKQSAQAQMDIMSSVDPMAYQQRQMRLAAGTKRIGELTGYNPNDFSASYPGAFQPANMSDVAALSDLAQQGRAIASNVSTAGMSKKGTNPYLINPNKAQDPNLLPPVSYY